MILNIHMFNTHLNILKKDVSNTYFLFFSSFYKNRFERKEVLKELLGVVKCTYVL